MKRRVLYVALILAATCLAGCRNDPDPPPCEPTIELSRIRIVGVPDDAAILVAVLDGGASMSRGLAAVAGEIATVGGGSSFVVSEIKDGVAVTPLYRGTDIMHFLWALLGYGYPVGMDPPIAVPDVTDAVVVGRGDVTVNYSTGLVGLMSAGAGTRVWRNVRFADFAADRVLTLDWDAGE